SRNFRARDRAGAQGPAAAGGRGRQFVRAARGCRGMIGHAMRMKCVALVFLAGCLALADSGPTRAESETAGGDGGAVRLLVNMAGTQSFPPFVIKTEGLDKKHGFVLETVPSATTQTTTTGLQSGAADMGIFGWNDLSRVKAGGVKIVGVAPFLGWANTI